MEVLCHSCDTQRRAPEYYSSEMLDVVAVPSEISIFSLQLVTNLFLGVIHVNV